MAKDASASDVILEPTRKPVVIGRPTTFINYAHPSDRHTEANRRAVSAFVASKYRRSLKSLQPTKPLPIGFHKRLQERSTQKGTTTESGVELVDSTLPARDITAPLRNVSGGLRMDPFDVLPVRGGHAVSLAMDYCESSCSSEIVLAS